MMVPRMIIILLPYMSAMLLQNKGPIANPKAGMATVQLTCAYEMENSSCRRGKDGTVVVVR